MHSKPQKILKTGGAGQAATKPPARASRAPLRLLAFAAALALAACSSPLPSPQLVAQAIDALIDREAPSSWVYADFASLAQAGVSDAITDFFLLHIDTAAVGDLDIDAIRGRLGSVFAAQGASGQVLLAGIRANHELARLSLVLDMGYVPAGRGPALAPDFPESWNLNPPRAGLPLVRLLAAGLVLLETDRGQPAPARGESPKPDPEAALAVMGPTGDGGYFLLQFLRPGDGEQVLRLALDMRSGQAARAASSSARLLARRLVNEGHSSLSMQQLTNQIEFQLDSRQLDDGMSLVSMRGPTIYPGSIVPVLELFEALNGALQ